MASDTHFTAQVEMQCEPDITPGHFLNFFGQVKAQVNRINAQCTSTRLLKTETDTDSTGKVSQEYTTYVETYKYPWVSERYVVVTNTIYKDYKGKGQHLYIATSKQNQELASAESLGSDFVSSRVLVEPTLAGYQCICKPEGGVKMLWMSHVSRDGVPEFLFKMTQLRSFPATFQSMYSLLKEQSSIY